MRQATRLAAAACEWKALGLMYRYERLLKDIEYHLAAAAAGGTVTIG